MLLDGSSNLPATPRRTTPLQALSGLFRTPTRLRTPATVSRGYKRARTRTSSLSSTSSTPTTANTSLPAVVMQTYSVSTDSIVLTALSSAPFCCHEDLLTMSRTQLEGVVRALNAQLPRRLRICPEDDFWQNNDLDHSLECEDDDGGLSRMSEAEMRKRIEELVGIRVVVGKNRVSRSRLGFGTRSGVPNAPKAVRTRDATWRPCEKMPWEMEVDATEDHSDDLNTVTEDPFIGSSPLASRSTYGLHVRGRGTTLPTLAILEEENECSQSSEDDAKDKETRPSKRQRVSSIQDSDGGFLIVREIGESKLIENMDISGSPLMTQDINAFSESFTECNESLVTSATNNGCLAETPDDVVKTPLQRRRSARIREIGLKRTSSVDSGKKATSTTRDLKSSILRSKTISSHFSSRNVVAPAGKSGTEKHSGTPREFTIRLPFTSTPPPHQKSDSSDWSAPRILRSNSRRVQNSSLLTERKTPLARSQSERYPRTRDLAFVTVNRPRYRLTQRRSRGSKVSNEEQMSNPSSTSLLEQDDAEHSGGKGEYEKENDDLNVTTGHPAIGNLHTLPSAPCSLAARSGAPSTSTIASIRGDSPVRAVAKEEVAPTEIMGCMVGDGVTERVWEALGRMAMDSM